MISPNRNSSTALSQGPIARMAGVGAALQRAGASGALKRWGVRLLVAVAALVVLWLLLLVAVQLITTNMWFDSVGHGSVYRTMIEAKVLLFVVFGGIAAVIGGLTMRALRTIEPLLYLSADDDTFRWTFRRYEKKFGRLLVLLAVVVPFVLVGRAAAGGWQTYLLWANATPWHSSDPTFHKDISFFVEVLPFHSMVVSLLTQAVTYCLWIALIGGYWYGAWRLRRGHRKIVRGMTTLASVLLAAFLVLKAANYWLARYGVVTSPRGPVTGAGYTDTNVAIPSKYVLVVVALLCAAALLANAVLGARVRVFDGRVRTATGALVVMVIASIVAGTLAPALVYRFREAPSAATLDLPEIAHNQKATRAAFGLQSDVTTVPYDASSSVTGSGLTELATTTAQTPVLDPNQLSPTFNVEQQLQAYYGFKSTLDNGHYDIDGKSQDVLLGVRELRAGGIPKSGWVNNHLVYTHGYGVVAAPTTEVDSSTESPVFLNGGIPPAQDIPVSRPQIYFGQAFTGSSSYAIVGQPKGSTKQLEFDHPGSNGSSKSVDTTYEGKGGIPIGSALRRLLFAVQLRDPNIFFSSELNSASQLLEVRDPRTRVAKVAPWLTLDGNVYPAVVDGQVKWIVDGYTSSSNYPDSQLVNLRSSTRTTLTANGASIAQPSTQVNYLQNSVKAVVDAYTGKVTLYSWNQSAHPDPLLDAWESAFPGLITPQSDIPSALLSQLRYPTDLFNVQRSLLAKYHVTQPAGFYSGNDFWAVPTDPTVAATNTINASTKTTTTVAAPPLPSKYISMSADGYGAQRYSLSSPLVTLNGRQLAAFVSVNSEPGPDYGKFTVLDFPAASGGESPSQVQNDIESDTTITEALTLQRGGNSKVVLGDLAAIPVAGKILYVEPVYTQSSGTSSFPILRHVIALYGNGTPSFQDTLDKALQEALQSGSSG